MPIIRAIITCVSMILACQIEFSYADMVHLKNGNAVEGRVIDSDSEHITLDFGSGVTMISKDNIVQIDLKPFEYKPVLKKKSLTKSDAKTRRKSQDTEPSYELFPSELDQDIAYEDDEVYWPPKLGKLYPNLKVIDHTGKEFHLRDFEGNVIIVEMVGMQCPTCEGLVGTLESMRERPHPKGGVWESLKEFKRYLAWKRYIILPDPYIVYIQILLFNSHLEPPTIKDAVNWVQEFDLRQSRNEYVLIPDPEYSSQISYNLVPGFQLIDQHFVLRADATGHKPQNDIYKDLIPRIKHYRRGIREPR